MCVCVCVCVCVLLVYFSFFKKQQQQFNVCGWVCACVFVRVYVSVSVCMWTAGCTRRPQWGQPSPAPRTWSIFWWTSSSPRLPTNASGSCSAAAAQRQKPTELGSCAGRDVGCVTVTDFETTDCPLLVAVSLHSYRLRNHRLSFAWAV